MEAKFEEGITVRINWRVMLSFRVYIKFWRHCSNQSYPSQTGNHPSDGFCRVLIASYQKCK